MEGRGSQSAPRNRPYKSEARLATNCAAGLMVDQQCQIEGLSMGHPAHQSFLLFQV